MGWPVRRVFRLVWWISCTATFCALPLTIWEFKRQGYSPHYAAWFIAGIFVILTIPISVYEVAMHTEYYTRPKLQRHVIRIIWMVPVYSLDAWFALRFQDARLWLDPIRECYEAYVIYNFYAYLMNFLEDELGNVEEYMEKKPPLRQLFPLNYCFGPWPMGRRFLWETKKGILNYVILRPLCTIIALITDHWGKYGEGRIDFSKSYIYLSFATNCSQMWALYCLVMFYTAWHSELAPIRPLSKFVCIKAVVFLTFWQGTAIALAVQLGIIRSSSEFSTFTAEDIAQGLQNFLICIEMFLAALAHAYAFPPRDYMDPNIPTKGFTTNVRYMFDLRDVVDDVQDVLEDHLQATTQTGKQALKKTAQGIVQTPGQLMSLFAHGRSNKEDGSPDEKHAALLDLEDGSNSLGRRTASEGSDVELSPEASLTDRETAPLKRHRV